MFKKFATVAVAAAFASGAAFAQATYGDDDRVMLDVEGEMVEVDIETAAEACGMDEEMVRTQAETQAGMAICEIDQATADEHGIEMEDEAS